MKKKFQVKDYIFYGLILFLIIQRLPGIINNFEKEGRSIPSLSYELLNGQSGDLSKIPGKKILVFWATWCPPCKIELERLHSAIKSGELPKDKVFLVNIAQRKEDVLKYYKENKFSFNTIMDYGSFISSKLEVSGTPTIMHVDDKNIIDHIGTGVSPLLIYRARYFLN